MKNFWNTIRELLGIGDLQTKMAEQRPHTILIEVTSIGASGTKSDSFDVGTNESYLIDELVFTRATGDFTLEILDQAGFAFQNKPVRYPAVGANPDHFNKYTLREPLLLVAGGKYRFVFADVSAATNNVDLLLRGVRNLD